ncbi:DUF2199 domain-containing protein [Corynebacterium crudilactis]|uniref:DUF2199 domain-containing protein n=1 Tax=Corynebacterium crudilactis TaxID=1652495 RepID=A0A172QSA9_9CORY|nr:DUF2199 domain-containing protein [Corynebacterium crudilactis]ANE03561.1 hypothetical protein ccrud_04585 [Corynebacterium crudilactis]
MKPGHFHCEHCGVAHFGAPALNLKLPDPIIEAQACGYRVSTGSSVCQILYPKPKRHFIKSNIEISIDAGRKKLDYGGWVEVTHSDLITYLNYRNHMRKVRIPGLLASKFPGLEDAYGTPVLLTVKHEDMHPHFQPLEEETTIFQDYTNGISSKEADLRINSWMLATHGHFH